MSFMKAQRLITLSARLLFFALLYFAFRAARVPAFPVLSPEGTAALMALLLTLPLGHASSFWFMTVASLSVIAVLYAIPNLLLYGRGIYPLWRRLTLYGYLPFLCCLLYLAIGLTRAKLIQKTRYPLTTPKSLPGGRLRIVHMADLHPWRLQTKKELGRLYHMIDEEKPDLIVLTGDVFDENTTPRQFSRYLQLFSALHPKYGIYFVFGNHDVSHHWKTPLHTKADITEKFPLAGIKILEDQCETIAAGALTLIGRKSSSVPRLSPCCLPGLDKQSPGYKILLCHEPVEFAECDAAGADLILAGHTHGGQIFPLGIVSHRLLRLHDGRVGCMKLSRAVAIITSGVGTWSYPIRTESRSEIVVVDLLQKEGEP